MALEPSSLARPLAGARALDSLADYHMTRELRRMSQIRQNKFDVGVAKLATFRPTDSACTRDPPALSYPPSTRPPFHPQGASPHPLTGLPPLTLEASRQMQIQVGLYSFSIMEPYSAGQPLSEGEARALNALRGERIRGLLLKRLAKRGSTDTLLPQDLFEEFSLEVASVDREFEFGTQAKAAAAGKRATLQDEIDEVSKEFARQKLVGLRGTEPSDEELEAAALAIAGDSLVYEEASRRFAARRETANKALLELMG